MNVTGIFDTSFRQLFTEGIPMKLEVHRESKIMQHPLEDGSSIVDHIVVSPLEISLMLFLTGENFKNIYSQILLLFNRGDLLIIQCKTTVFKNMVITGMPHQEDPDMMNVIPVNIILTEARFIKTQFQALPPQAVRYPRDQSIVKRGEQMVRPVETASTSTISKSISKPKQEAPITKSSLAYRLFH